ncbi:hypothetical protein THAOC_06665, partial [Thalassiosira oceanica]
FMSGFNSAFTFSFTHGLFASIRGCVGQKKPESRFELPTLSLLMTCSNQLSYTGRYLP